MVWPLLSSPLFDLFSFLGSDLGFLLLFLCYELLHQRICCFLALRTTLQEVHGTFASWHS